MPDIVTSKTFVDGEKGITAAKLNQIISGAVIQPSFYSAKPSSATLDPTDVLLELKGTGAYAQITGAQIAGSVAGQLPLADATQNGMLRKVSGLTTDVVDGTNHCVPFSSFAGITQMRLRSYNAIGNPTFEVDQRNANSTVANASGLICDRWSVNRITGGTATVSAASAYSGLGGVLLPGTNFTISSNVLLITLTAQQVALGATDLIYIGQTIEGSRMRELINDVHSLSILAYCSVPLVFSVAFSDPTGTRSLVQLCTIPTANTWTLFTLPNLPVWSSGGAWSIQPGAAGYLFRVGLAAGSSYVTAPTSAWQNGNFIGATGMDNFASKPVNTVFYLGFVQHEPGSLCTTPMDCPFAQNYDDCLRYFAKSYDYKTKPGTVTANGSGYAYVAASGNPYQFTPFSKRLAKVPTVTGYSAATGTANTVRDAGASVDRVISAVIATGEASFSGFGTTTQNAAASTYQIHYISDTGW